MAHTHPGSTAMATKPMATTTEDLIQWQDHWIAIASIALVFATLAMLWAASVWLGMTTTAALPFVSVLDGTVMLGTALSVDVFDDYGDLWPVNRLAQMAYWVGNAMAYAGAIAIAMQR